MPVRKFRSVAEMPGPPALPPLDPANLRTACELMDLAARLRPMRLIPGVRRFRNLEEADTFRRAWEREQIQGGGQ